MRTLTWCARACVRVRMRVYVHVRAQIAKQADLKVQTDQTYDRCNRKCHLRTRTGTACVHTLYAHGTCAHIHSPHKIKETADHAALGHA